jgi:prevent-host-death family protein
MKRLTATEAARRFSDVLDSVESKRETFVVVRKGRPVARIGPAVAAGGAAVKAMLRAHPPDKRWLDELQAMRADLGIEDRRWSA